MYRLDSVYRQERTVLGQVIRFQVMEINQTTWRGSNSELQLSAYVSFSRYRLGQYPQCACSFGATPANDASVPLLLSSRVQHLPYRTLETITTIFKNTNNQFELRTNNSP